MSLGIVSAEPPSDPSSLGAAQALSGEKRNGGGEATRWVTRPTLSLNIATSHCTPSGTTTPVILTLKTAQPPLRVSPPPWNKTVVDPLSLAESNENGARVWLFRNAA